MVDKTSLQEVFREVVSTFTPIPPPLKLKEEEKASTFAVDLSKMLVTAPKYWRKLKYTKELLGHEVKHGSADGLPYTFKNALRFEAETMRLLDLPLTTVRNILNVVYDAVVDLRVAKEGLDAKGMNQEWLKRFPIKKEVEGTSYHLLYIMYKDLFGVRLKKTQYEAWVRSRSEYRRLLQIIRGLAEEGGLYREERSVEEIVEAAHLISRLSRVVEMPQNRGDVGFNRADPEVRSEAAEIGMDMGLDENT